MEGLYVKKTLKKYVLLGLTMSVIAATVVTIILISNPDMGVPAGETKIYGIFGILIMVSVCIINGAFAGIFLGLISYLFKLIFKKIISSRRRRFLGTKERKNGGSPMRKK